MYRYILLLCFCIKYVYSEFPIVITTQGFVRGLAGEDGDYNMYLGIPYGIVDPNNPFGPSSPHPDFDGTFNAIDDSAICPQVEEFNGTLAGSLDCLHLSVFVPTNTVATPKPVLVWIFGGRFELGYYGRYLYGPKYLVRHDIILVTLNYRLGPYGFMCTDHPRVPGNQGLKDQLLALKWVAENIGNFGGDPNKVTVAGNSAGSMSTDFQILRNHQPRLFNQAILQSGTSLASSFPFPNKNAPLILSQHFGLETHDITKALDFLAPIDPLSVIEASNVLGFAFRPCIENNFEGVDPFVSHNWVANENMPSSKDMNIMIGFNDDESLAGFFLNRSIANSIDESLSPTFDIDHDDFSGVSQVKNFFFGDEVIDYDVLQEAGDLRSDMSFIYPAIRSLGKFLKNEVGKVYLYMFTYSGGRNFVKLRNNITQGGAMHADEIGYLFDIEYMDEPAVDDQLVLDRMTEMWTNFVKYGDPTPETTPLLPLKWEPITTASDHHYMDINLQLTAGTRPLNERMAFWDMFFELNRHLQLFILSDEKNYVSKQLLDVVIPY